MPIALDYRPALLSPAGIGRSVRELAAALAARDDVVLHLFGHCLARARVPTIVPPRARLWRWPLPARALPHLRRLGLGADHLAGGARLFHWTDYVHPPVARARVVLTVHDLAFVREPRWHGDDAMALATRTRQALAAATAVVAPSAATAADVQAFAPSAPRPRVIPFGADHATAAAIGPHPLQGRPFVLCVGTLEPRKNHRTLLAAWRTLPANRPLLWIVGRPGWECDAIVADVEAGVTEGTVRWSRDLDDAAMFTAMAHARLLVYPSLWEGFGFPPLEAMQLGTPVVANACAPLAEVTDGAACLVDATDPGALAAAVQRLLTDDHERMRLRELGRERAAACTWRNCAAAHAALYHEVAG